MARISGSSLLAAGVLVAPVSVANPQVNLQTAGEYTRYELLAPGSAQFKIIYHVTATTPGARVFFNPIRKGSEATDESVIDPSSGRPLPFRIVPGSAAKAEGLVGADAETSYIRVELPAPVAHNGQRRLTIIKTYRDPKSYLVDGQAVTFNRSLSIPRNAVVLPAGYELIGVNYPSQVLTEADGRTLVSFVNVGADPVSLVVKGRVIQ